MRERYGASFSYQEQKSDYRIRKSGNQEIRKGKKSDGLKEALMKSHEGH
jgi:hypothetical protein